VQDLQTQYRAGYPLRPLFSETLYTIPAFRVGMPALKRVVYAALALLGFGAARAQQEHWTNGASATGTTDPNVTKDCTY
jgi:hypothetical protein